MPYIVKSKAKFLEKTFENYSDATEYIKHQWVNSHLKLTNWELIEVKPMSIDWIENENCNQ